MMTPSIAYRKNVVEWYMHCNENLIYVGIPGKELRGLSPKFHIMCLWAIYLFPGSVQIFSCRRI